MSYDPVESLAEEIKRFKSTNRFDPLQITNFYVQGGLVVNECLRLREECLSLRKAATRFPSRDEIDEESWHGAGDEYVREFDKGWTEGFKQGVTWIQGWLRRGVSK
jgi:hypothetical protein